MVSVNPKSVTFANGNANDGSQVNSEMTALFNNDNTLATAVTAIEGGTIATGTTLTMNANFGGSPSSDISFVANRGVSTDTAVRWNETNDWWEVTHDGTNYYPISLVKAGDPASPTNGFIWYDSTANQLKARINGATAVIGGSAPIGYIQDLTLSNNVSDANNDIDIATGAATDDTGVKTLTLSSGLTKRSDAAWSAGTGNGGMDTGSKPTSGTLHVWLIGKAADSSIDVLFSTSATSPTMPSTWDLKRRIGAVLTDGSSNIVAFYQNQDEFLVKSPVLDINATDGTTATLRTLTVPNGIRVKAILTGYVTNAAGVAGTYISSPDQTDLAPSETAAPLLNIYGDDNSGVRQGASQLQVWTDTSRQVRSRSLNASTTLRLSTFGWVDLRGKK
jgi:hypothetical protein